MGVNKAIILISTGLVILSGVIILAFERKFGTLEKEYTQEVKIEKTWELPDELEEVSGIAFIDKNNIACIQDEDGIIFIYNLKRSKIEKEIPFGDSGDYEGVAVAGKTAYVLESDGTIYRVDNFLSDPKVSEYETRLSENNDVEGLAYDKKNNRLLLAVKDKDPVSEDYKGIYAFDLKENKLAKKPAFKLQFDEKVFDDISEKDKQDIFKPSEVILDPASGEIYLVEGEDPQLLILDASGKAKALYDLDKDDFPQPEGLAFDRDGAFYISNEGEPGTIHKVLIKK
jgi:uncharacterized protein YjiK